jgi:hypothetical protein
MKTENITNVIVQGIKPEDAPDYVDAYIASANINGEPMTEFELEELNEDKDYVYLCVCNQIY